MKESVNVLVCCTGSVASIKLPVLLDLLSKEISCCYDVSLKYCLTEKALHFCSKNDVPSYEGYTDEDEWNAWKGRGDPVLHIDLSKWADILILAPLDANSLAKIANGICDNLVLCLVRAWDVRKPLIFCPAMNTKMWAHPITAKHTATLKEWGYQEIPPISKVLMCGDEGVGAMAEVPTIVEFVVNCIPKSLAIRETPRASAI